MTVVARHDSTLVLKFIKSTEDFLKRKWIRLFLFVTANTNQYISSLLNFLSFTVSLNDSTSRTHMEPMVTTTLSITSQETSAIVIAGKCICFM